MELVKRPDVVLRNKSLKQRKFVSDSWKNTKIRDIRIEKISKANKGKKFYDIHPMLGKKHSVESIKKMHKSHVLQGSWLSKTDKSDPRRINMGKLSGKSRTGKTYDYMKKSRPWASKKIVETMASGKMKKVFNTKPELKMKSVLERMGIDYLFQQKIDGFMVDFLIKERGIIIEVDGEYWHSYPRGRDKDRKRDSILSGLGYKVIRFWANDVLKENNEFLKTLEDIADKT